MFRRFVDVRTTPLLIGAVQFMWALIPLLDDKDLSLFAKVLAESDFEVWWMASNLTLGLFLALSAVIKWRNMLLLTEALSGIMWLSTFAPFKAQAIYTPVVISMLIFGIVCFLALAREVFVGINYKCGNKTLWAGESGFRDLQRPA